MQKELAARLENIFGRPVQIKDSNSVGGGCINQTQRLSLDTGDRVFLKSNAQAPENFFRAEAMGLKLLALAKDGPKIPKLLEIPSRHSRFFLLEYIEETSPPSNYPEAFARALANMHRATRDKYGLDHDNFIGKTKQPNDLENDGLVFFRDKRLGFQQELARKQGLLPKDTDKRIDSLRERLQELMNVEGERPALLHGDLWSGNHFPSGGKPCLFDPAVYYGFREADLAMTKLFGSLPERFYSAYREVFPQNPGWAEREDIFNLYHLLNHLNLFGASYLGSVKQIVNRY